MADKVKQLEARVAQLERALIEVRSLLATKEDKPGIESIFGIFKDSEVFDEVIEEIRKQRAEDREAQGCTTPDPFGTPVRPRKKGRVKKGE